MNWQRLGKGILLGISALSVIAFAVWLFIAFGPDECFAFVQAAILAIAAYVGLKTWRLDVEKRLDPLRQEVHRQCIQSYRSLIQAMERVVSAAYEDSFENVSEAYRALREQYFGDLHLIHASVFDEVKSFVGVAYEVAAPSDSRKPDEALQEYRKRLIQAFSKCICTIRKAVGTEHLQVDIAQWFGEL